MELKLSETWSIQKDQYNWILLKNRVVEDKNSNNFGKVYQQPVGYYNHITDLIRAAIEKGMADPEIRSIIDIRQYLDDTCKEIHKHILSLKDTNAVK